MLRSLWFKLVGAFAIVIAVMLVAIIVVVNLATARQFDLYVTQNGRMWAERLAPLLADQYLRDGDWRNARAILSLPRPGHGPGMMNNNPEQDMMGGDNNMWGMMGLRLLLVDDKGKVIVDTGGSMEGTQLESELIAQGVPIIVEGQRVGTLLAGRPQQGDPIRKAFLSDMGKAVLWATLAAGIAALLIGTVLFQWITFPLQQLQRAARAVAEGKPARVPVTSQDELGAVAEAFNQMASRLDQQQRLRKQMVADIAHELRTPISVMQGTLEAMLDGVLKPKPSELRDLYDETRRLARLVEDLRTLSLADANQLSLERIPINLAMLVENTAERMRPLAEARQVLLGVQIEQPILLAEADEDRLSQVLTNLIDNALRYTPYGKHVVVRAARVDNQACLEVIDEGQGIPAEDLPYVFERFWRGDRSRNRESGGSGIGLAIVKQLVEMHGGHVAVESQPGKGSTFRVFLPLSRPEEAVRP
jgi:signal transduction histidine kinase